MRVDRAQALDPRGDCAGDGEVVEHDAGPDAQAREPRRELLERERAQVGGDDRGGREVGFVEVALDDPHAVGHASSHRRWARYVIELTDQDKLVYVNEVILGKMLESETLRKQAGSNTKEQFATSPDLDRELVDAIMGAYDAHTAMSTQALNSPAVQRGLKDILLNFSGLWEALRARAAG